MVRGQQRIVEAWQGSDRFADIGRWLDVRDKRMLDVGCGRCGLEIALNLAGRNEVHGVDRSPSSPDYRLKLTSHDIETGLPYGDGFFDVVVCLEVIEHLRNRSLLLDEMHRVLKDGGTLIISTPNRNSIEGILSRALSPLGGKRWNAWDETHVHLFSSGEFERLVGRRFAVKDSMGLYFLWKPAERLLSGRLPGAVRRARMASDRVFSRNAFVKRLAFDIVLKCVKERA